MLIDVVAYAFATPTPGRLPIFMNDLSNFATSILAVSLATERMVAIAKTIAPRWLAEEQKTAANAIDPIADKVRRLKVMALALVCAFVTSVLIGDPSDQLLGLPRYVKFAGDQKISTILLAILASGGSAFWTSVIGYTSAAKDVKTQQRTTDGLNFRLKTEQQGVAPTELGATVRSRLLSNPLTAKVPSPSITLDDALKTYTDGVI